MTTAAPHHLTVTVVGARLGAMDGAYVDVAITADGITTHRVAVEVEPDDLPGWGALLLQPRELSWETDAEPLPLADPSGSASSEGTKQEALPDTKPKVNARASLAELADLLGPEEVDAEAFMSELRGAAPPAAAEAGAESEGHESPQRRAQRRAAALRAAQGPWADDPPPAKKRDRHSWPEDAAPARYQSWADYLGDEETKRRQQVAIDLVAHYGSQGAAARVTGLRQGQFSKWVRRCAGVPHHHWQSIEEAATNAGLLGDKPQAQPKTAPALSDKPAPEAARALATPGSAWSKEGKSAEAKVEGRTTRLRYMLESGARLLSSTCPTDQKVGRRQLQELLPKEVGVDVTGLDDEDLLQEARRATKRIRDQREAEWNFGNPVNQTTPGGAVL